MTSVHRTEIDGVPCFWVDSGRPTLSATLLFRAGLVDESFTEHGWRHLLEHSALHGRGSGTLSVNGSVSLTTTTFDAHGPVERVVNHFDELARWLAAPDFSDIDRESRVLLAEERVRGRNSAADALLWRYGAQGPGLSAMPEFGLTRANAAHLTRLARTTYTAANAILALDGPPPPDLRLPLLPGTGTGSIPLPDAQPCALAFPGLYRTKGLVMSGVVNRTVAATLLPVVLETRVRTRFRDRAGAAYAPWSTYEPVDSTSAVVLCGTDLAEVVVGPSAVDVQELVARTIEFGPEGNSLRDHVDQAVQRMSDPFNVAAFAWRAAHRALARECDETPEEVLAQLQAVTADDIQKVAAEFAGTILIGAPERAARPRSYTIVNRPAPPPPNGRQFRSRNWPADSSSLSVGDQHVSARSRTTAIGVELGGLVGLVQHDNGTRDLIAADAWNLTIDPTDWHNGDEATALIDSWVPDLLHVASIDETSTRQQSRMSWRRRWWGGFRRVLRARRGTVGGTMIVLPIGLVLIAAGIASHVYVVGVVGLSWIVRSLFYLVRGRGRETKHEVAQLHDRRSE